MIGLNNSLVEDHVAKKAKDANLHEDPIVKALALFMRYDRCVGRNAAIIKDDDMYWVVAYFSGSGQPNAWYRQLATADRMTAFASFLEYERNHIRHTSHQVGAENIYDGEYTLDIEMAVKLLCGDPLLIDALKDALGT